MYILILVTTLLMMLSIMGYTRMEIFRSSMGLQYEYERYMEKKELAAYNQIEKEKYQAEKSSSKKKQETPGPPKPFAKLNVSSLFEEKPQASPEYQDFVRATLTRILAANYSSLPFFQNTHTQPAEFVEALITKGKEKGVCRPNVDSMEALTEIAFDDLKMREAYYLMLKGAKEGDPKEGSYPPLLELLTFQKGETPIRLYLAPKGLLLALYQGDAAYAEKVMQVRKEIFKKVKSSKALFKDEEEEKGSEALQEEVKRAMEEYKQDFMLTANVNLFSGIPERYLDFSVSGTAPPSK